MDLAAEDVLSVFPSLQRALPTRVQNAISCYVFWVNSHLRELNALHNRILPEIETGTEKTINFSILRWKLASQELRSGNGLATTLQALVDAGCIRNEALTCDRNEGLSFVHGLLGLQTMLYVPVKSTLNPERFQIRQELRGFSGLGIIETSQSASGANQRLHKYLLNFGIMLPPRAFDPYEIESDAEDRKLVSAEVCPAKLNAKLLATLGRVTFRWTDSIACHLEFDKEKREIYLFRYPSFCINSWIAKPGEKDSRATIHGCAKSSGDVSDWATADEVSMLMREIMLSYRLLFGQRQDSRRFFRKHGKPWEDVQPCGRDELLKILCSQKNAKAMLDFEEKDVYDIYYDFPMLYGKMRHLCSFIDHHQPRTLRQIWQDKRDNSAWLTLWVVIILGALGTLLALMQVILAIIPLVK